jgi:hypothetical protein
MIRGEAMVFSEHKMRFEGKDVVDYEPGMTLEPDRYSYRLRLDWEAEQTFPELLAAFLAAPNVDQVTGLLTGSYSNEMFEGGDETLDSVAEAVVAAGDRLASLTGLFIGDIICEECEVSWLQSGDMSPVWQAFPRLRTFGTRGCDGLSLGKVIHDQLQSLIVEGGGLPQNVLHELARSQLPELEHLELYLGTEGYGWSGTIDDVRALLGGELFPRLKYLGLRDSEIADDVAALVCQSPLLERIEVLDLSLGTLSDAGGKVLLECPAIRHLKRLELEHNYLSDEVRAQLQQLPIEVNADPAGAEIDEYDGEQYRYVAIGE